MKFEIREDQIYKSFYLFIERNGIMVKQYCPFTSDAPIGCGTWCPHFGEMKKEDVLTWDHENKKSYFRLELCNNKVLTSDTINE